MAEENKKKDTITVPNVFPTNNPNIMMVSIVDPASKNGFRSFGVFKDEIVSQNKQVGKDGKEHTLSTVKLDYSPSRQYDTSILVGKDEAGKPIYEHAKPKWTAEDIYNAWDKQNPQNKKDVQVENSVQEPVKAAESAVEQPKTPEASSAAPKEKPKLVILNNVPKSDMTPANEPGKPTRIRIPDEASNCGYGFLRVMPNKIFQQPNRSPKLGDLAHADVANVNLGSPGTKLYYQIQDAHGKWGSKTKEDGSEFTNTDLAQMWKDKQMAGIAKRAEAIVEKGEQMTAKPVEQPVADASYDPSDDEVFA